MKKAASSARQHNEEAEKAQEESYIFAEAELHHLPEGARVHGSAADFC